MEKKTSKLLMEYKKFYLLIIVCLFSIGIFAQSGTEKISISFSKIPLKEAMARVEKASGYLFSYDATEINAEQLVSLNCKNEEVRLALRKMFEPTNITFKFQNKQIVLALSSKDALTSKKGTTKTVTGTVSDGAGEPIIGATVIVKGTINGVLTDMDGKYTIKAREGEVLEFRYIGYNSVEQKVKDKSVINIAMAESNVNLDDVVVIGYGSQKKESVVSSVNTMKPAEIAIPTRSLSNTIAGQVAGVIAIQRSGEPGNDDADFWIRGQSSYAGGTSPLVLVDGVPRSMNDLDTDEIETFTVLKDAAATAVYGSEGANGVVLITTKRGRAQKTIITFNAQYSIATPTRMPELMNSWDYLSMWNEASWNDAGNPNWDSYMQNSAPYSAEALARYRDGVDPDLYPNSIWTDLLSNNTQNQRYTVNLRGGSEKTKFFVSGAYYKENGMFKSNPLDDYNANIGLERYNLRSNVDMDITPTTKLSVDMSGQYRTQNNPGNSSDQIFKHIILFPTHLVPFTWSDGTAAVCDTDADGRYNPYNLLNYSGYSKKWSVAMQTKATLRQKLDFITKGLSVQGSISFDADFSSTLARSTSPDKYTVKGRDENGQLIKTLFAEGSPLGEASVSTSSGTKKIYIEAQLNYERTFAKKHAVTGTFVYNQKETQYQGSRNSSGAQTVGGLQLLPYRKQNIVMRGTYAYDGRYILEASFGATGSENFAPGNRYGVFPAGSIGWVISREAFMKGTEKWLDNLKLRASFGLVGSDKISDNNDDRFAYLQFFQGGDGYSFGFNEFGSGYDGLKEGNFANPNLTWEKARKTNVGFDATLFNGKLTIAADYFREHRYDIITTLSDGDKMGYPDIVGKDAPFVNSGIVDNQGIDFELGWNSTIGKDFRYYIKPNFTFARNKIKFMNEVDYGNEYRQKTGRRLGEHFVYVVDHFVYDQAEADKLNAMNDGRGFQPWGELHPGDVVYKDLNQDGKIDDYGDRTHMGFPRTPEIQFGIPFGIQYKGFDISVMFQGSLNSSILLNGAAVWDFPSYEQDQYGKVKHMHLNRWTEATKDVATYPRLTYGAYENNKNGNSSLFLYNANYIRLKNLEVGYSLPKNIIRFAGLQNVRFYVQGLNLLTFDSLDDVDMDPETKEGSGDWYPIQRVYNFGVEITY